MIARAAVAVLFALTACTAADTESPAPSPGSCLTWERGPDLPSPRQEVAAVFDGSRLIVAGGLVPGGATARVDAYDPSSRRWSRLPDLPTTLHHAAAAVLDGRAYVLGGYGPSGATKAAYVLDGDRWVAVAPMANARGALAAATAVDRIVVVGGESGGAHVAGVEVFDGSAWREGAAMPSVRDHLAAVGAGGSVYAIAGRVGSISRNVGAFERYDVADDRWVTLPEVPTPRGGLGAAVRDGEIWVVGGEGRNLGANDDGVFDLVEAFDIAAGTWRMRPAPAEPRHGIGVAAAADGTLYVAAGADVLGAGAGAVLEVSPRVCP